MGQLQTKPLSAAASGETRIVVRRCVKHLPLEQRLAAIKASTVLDELSASDRRTALNIIRKQYKCGELDYPWFEGFLEILRVLKAEENHF